MMGRLRPDVTLADTRSEVTAAAKALSTAAASAPAEIRATVVSLRDQMTGTVRPALLILFAAVGLVLLVACANVVNIQLARQVAQERDAAIRWTLGASRGRLVRQSLTESLLLAVIGAAGGIALAVTCVRLLTRLNPPGLPRLDAVQVDATVLLFSIGLAALAALATGLVPALQSASAADALKFGAGRVTTGVRSGRIRRVLCAVELAVSLVLLVGASLLGRSLYQLMNTDLGVTTDRVVTASINLAFGGRPRDEQALERIERVIDRIQALPGVAAAGVGISLPPQVSRLRLTLRKGGDSVDYQASGVAVTPGYFQVLGMRLLSGRLFTADDDRSRPPVMIMSVDTARRFFGDGDPIGQTMTLPATRNGVNASEVMTLVGVVANVKVLRFGRGGRRRCLSAIPSTDRVAPYLVARTIGEPDTLLATLRREIAAVDRAIVVSDVAALDSIVANAAAQPRFRTILLAVMAGLAALMAVIGLYGVMAYSISQRTREMGIRLAPARTVARSLGWCSGKG